jgi:hypothetical protein
MLTLELSDEDRKSIQHKRKFPVCDNSTSNNLCYQESFWGEIAIKNERWDIKVFSWDIIFLSIRWLKGSCHDREYMTFNWKKVICLEMLMKSVLKANFLLSSILVWIYHFVILLYVLNWYFLSMSTLQK